MTLDQIVAFGSLILAIFFWWSARQQAATADRALQEIKSQIIGWQSELNRTAMDLLSSRPEMIAKQSMLIDTQSEADFIKATTKTIDSLAANPTPENIELISRLLAHHATIVLEKQKIGMAAATR